MAAQGRNDVALFHCLAFGSQNLSELLVVGAEEKAPTANTPSPGSNRPLTTISLGGAAGGMAALVPEVS